jgi:hypothetical protein
MRVVETIRVCLAVAALAGQAPAHRPHDRPYEQPQLGGKRRKFKGYQRKAGRRG